jgi:hypothetical protein
MSASTYARIAERYQVPASDDEAVERFFLDVAPTLSREEREAIVAELQGDELTSAPAQASHVPGEVPNFPIDDAPPIARPAAFAQLVSELTAAVEKRVSNRLEHSLMQAMLRMEMAVSGGPVISEGKVIALVYASVQESVRGAVSRMTEANVALVAVLDQERLVGILSEHDIVARVVAKGLDPDDTPVASVMTPVN